MTEDRFERELRDLLAARDPGAAPASLHERVAQVPAATSALQRDRWLSRVASAAQLAAATAVILGVVGAVVTRQLQPPGPETGAVPAAGSKPFVVSPGDLFSEAARADAERRLAEVFRATGVEATLVVNAEAGPGQLSTPEGFPERYDRDGSDRRDVMEVAGLAPDRSMTCCLTVMGQAVERAASNGAWRPSARARHLDVYISSGDQAQRDRGLDIFVAGIETLADRVVEADRQLDNEAMYPWLAGGVSLGGLALVVGVSLRRRERGEPPPSPPSPTRAGRGVGAWL